MGNGAWWDRRGGGDSISNGQAAAGKGEWHPFPLLSVQALGELTWNTIVPGAEESEARWWPRNICSVLDGEDHLQVYKTRCWVKSSGQWKCAPGIVNHQANTCKVLASMRATRNVENGGQWTAVVMESHTPKAQTVEMEALWPSNRSQQGRWEEKAQAPLRLTLNWKKETQTRVITVVKDQC